MRIAISGMFWLQPHTNAGRYLRSLLFELTTQPTTHRFVLIIPRYLQPQRPTHAHIQTVFMPTPFDARWPGLARLWFEQVALGQACRRLRADLLHVPYLGPPGYARLPTVVTIHDLFPFVLPIYRGNRSFHAYMRLAASGTRRSTAVIATSHYTRQTVIEHLAVAPQKIHTIYPAVRAPFGPQVPEVIAAVKTRFLLDDPYIYYAGGFDVHKNVAVVIKAFAAARPELERRVLFVIAGQQPTGEEPLFPDINRAILEAQVAADVVLLGPVSEAENAALMGGCECFVYPSRYEGFGLRPLEAMACGAPVLAADISGVGEVVGDGGVRLPPDDSAAWGKALARVLNDPVWQNELRARALQRARMFSWSQTARQTLGLYEECGDIHKTEA